MKSPQRMDGPGPFTAAQMKSGDRYEISNGHTIYCAPSGLEQARAVAAGTRALGSDPAAAGQIAVDAGFSIETKSLRAPDISVGGLGTERGWGKGAPRLAVEYAGIRQDEDTLQEKITDLLAAGTELVWVVRLVGPRRVEIYAPDAPMQIVASGGTLTAPGILQASLPAESLWDEDAAASASLEGLLGGYGYRSLDEVRAEGAAEGKAEGKEDALRASLLRLGSRRGFAWTAAERKAIASAAAPTLEVWLDRVIDAATSAEVLSPTTPSASS